MVRSIQILSVVLLLTLASVVRAQTCDAVAVDGPSEVEQGMPIVLKARVTGMVHTTKPEFKWWVSVGTITSGQGTEEISVDSTGLAGQVITVTVELSGCKESSKTIQVTAPPITCGLAFDQYGDIKFEDEKARLDNFAIQLSNQPLSSGSILMSAGQETFANETSERLARAKSYLVNVREVDRNRIVTVDCGFTQDLRIQLYIVPVGASPPSCNNSTETPFEIKLTKPRPRSSKRRR